jgi:hypothetical protein
MSTYIFLMRGKVETFETDTKKSKLSSWTGLSSFSPLKVNWRFGQAFRLHLQGRTTKVTNQEQSSTYHLFHEGFLSCLFFEPVNGGDMFLRNVGWPSSGNTPLYPRR